jgi:hypothetical protein
MFNGNTYDQERTYEDGKQFADDDKLFVKFEVRPLHNKHLSDIEGRPIFQDEEYISIITPGSRDVFTTPLDDTYRRRFKKRYTDWKDNNTAAKIDGTLLSELPWLTKSQIAELNYSNVFTIEQLASLSDANAMQFMGNHKLRERAKLYLDQAKGDAPMLKLQSALEERDLRVQTLERKLEELTAALERQNAESGKRR